MPIFIYPNLEEMLAEDMYLKFEIFFLSHYIYYISPALRCRDYQPNFKSVFVFKLFYSLYQNFDEAIRKCVMRLLQ